MKQIKKSITGCAVCISLLSACGGGSNDNGDLLRGVFLDSPVQGLQYRTETQQGLTDADGGFGYLPGETVVFGVGELEFARVPAQATMTPMELAQTDDIESPEVVNILRLLQTIDEDRNPENGIVIPQAARDNVLAPTFSFSVDMESVIRNVIMQTYNEPREIVDAEVAVDHLVDTLSARASVPQAAGDAGVFYLVEDGQVFDGSYLAIDDTDFELNLGGEGQNGVVDESSGVYELAGESRHLFFTPGLDDQGAQTGCLSSRPSAVAECDGGGKRFRVFTNEAAAIEFSDQQLAALTASAATTDELTETTEPEFEAALEGPEDSGDAVVANPDLLKPEDLFPACSADLADEDGDQYGWESGETCYFVTAPTESEAVSEAPVPVETEAPVLEEVVEVEEIPQQPAAQAPASEVVEAEQPLAETPAAEELPETASTITATTDCPTAPRSAPATFSVIAKEPAGCTWTPFTNGPVWSWGNNTNYVVADNTVTNAVSGVHQGNFEHSCIDVASGREVTVTAFCEVTVDAAPGVEDITDLFFLTGQSNAASLETAYDPTLDAVDSRVFAYTDTGWQVADLHQFWEQDLPGNYSIQYPERSPYNNIVFQVAKSIAAQSDRVVGFVVLTAPGEGISHWDYNSDFFIEVREKATAALNTLPNKNSFDGMLWLQGETDWLLTGSADPGATGFTDVDSDFYRNYYPNKLFQLINNLRTESWFGVDGKFICAETKKAELNAHLMALNSDSDEFSGCAGASDLATRATDPFGSHFSAESLRTLGGRIADIYLDMLP